MWLLLQGSLDPPGASPVVIQNECFLKSEPFHQKVVSWENSDQFPSSYSTATTPDIYAATRNNGTCKSLENRTLPCEPERLGLHSLSGPKSVPVSENCLTSKPANLTHFQPKKKKFEYSNNRTNFVILTAGQSAGKEAVVCFDLMLTQMCHPPASAI